MDMTQIKGVNSTKRETEANLSKVSKLIINENLIDSQIVHEASIGGINNEQLLKLETFGLSEEEAKEVIVNAVLS